jgi:CotH kinase protein/Secretion system C-terminal sorting domain
MKKLIFLTLLCCSFLTKAQTLTESNLPIIIINTSGAAVPDEPKIAATMKIIWKSDGQMNKVSDQTYNYDGKIGIEVRGSTSASLSEKKPYAIEIRDAAGNDVDTSLLGMPKESDWALIAPYSDKTLIRDAVIYTLARSFMEYAPRVRHCELILNDTYMGVFVLTEKIKRNKNRVNITKTDATAVTGSDAITGGYILKIDKTTGDQPSGVSLSFKSTYLSGATAKTEYLYDYPKPEDITTAQKTYIRGAVSEFEDAMNGSNAINPNLGYPKYFDVNSLIDFATMNEIGKNVDGYRLSTFLYKDKNSVNSKFKMGPVWDFNIALGNADYCSGNSAIGWGYNFNTVCPSDFWVIPFWWKKIVDDNSFKGKWRSRWTKLRARELSDARITGLIDSMTNLLAVPQTRNFQKWNILTKKVWPNPQINNSYSGEVAYLKSWLAQRLTWLDGQIATFPLVGTQEIVEQAYVFPNPSISNFQFRYNLAETGKVKFLIFNQLGQTVFQNETQQTAGANEWSWHNEKPSGLYFYEIHLNNKRILAGKLVKE